MLGAYARRKITDVCVRSACVAAAVVALIPLVSVLYYVTARGIGGINLDFFTELPKPVGESGGGMANAIVGTLKLVFLACAIGIPPGVLAGVYLAEFGHSRFGKVVRFSADVMSGVPSITVGIFVYSLVVLQTKQFRRWPVALHWPCSCCPPSRAPPKSCCAWFQSHCVKPRSGWVYPNGGPRCG